jgi:UDP-glucose 4-epimerase
MSATATDLRTTRILVTGALGFIGTHLCRALSARGASIVALTHGDAAADLGRAERHEIDLRNRDAVRGVVRAVAPDVVAHLAGLKLGTALTDFRACYDANLLATLHLAEAVIEAGGCERFVYLGSAEEYGCSPVPFEPAARETPLTGYGLSKLAATQLLQALAETHGLPVTVLRATVVYGPGQAPGMFVPALVAALVEGHAFPMTAGEQTRDFVYVDDVVAGIVAALDSRDRHDGALHLSTGIAVPVRDVAQLAARLIGGRAESLLRLGEVEARPGEAASYWADPSATRTRLGWSPHVSLEEGLRRTIAHYRAVSSSV